MGNMSYANLSVYANLTGQLRSRNLALAINMPKIIKISKNLTKLSQTTILTFFS